MMREAAECRSWDDSTRKSFCCAVTLSGSIQFLILVVFGSGRADICR
jgi:hypothetical protein